MDGIRSLHKGKKEVFPLTRLSLLKVRRLDNSGNILFRIWASFELYVHLLNKYLWYNCNSTMWEIIAVLKRHVYPNKTTEWDWHSSVQFGCRMFYFTDIFLVWIFCLNFLLNYCQLWNLKINLFQKQSSNVYWSIGYISHACNSFKSYSWRNKLRPSKLVSRLFHDLSR